MDVQQGSLFASSDSDDEWEYPHDDGKSIIGPNTTVMEAAPQADAEIEPMPDGVFEFKDSSGAFDGAQVIYAYTNEQAVADGMKVDVTEWAKEAGFKIPVFFTRGVYDLCENIPDGVAEDKRGRAHDILYVGSRAVLVKMKKEGEWEARLTEYHVRFADGEGLPDEYTFTDHRLWCIFNEHEGFSIILPHEY
jgi:hypothetical protein